MKIYIEVKYVLAQCSTVSVMVRVILVVGGDEGDSRGGRKLVMLEYQPQSPPLPHRHRHHFPNCWKCFLFSD